MRYTTNGKAVVSFSLAVNRDGKKDESDWIDFVAWEKTAEVIAQRCHKGDLIGVTGNLQRREWEKDGQKRYSHEVRVHRIDFCGGKKSADAGNVPAADEDGFVPITEDDGNLPF
jgi:single-strand DNA-binding protein